jgi:hypothetical protein
LKTAAVEAAPAPLDTDFPNHIALYRARTQAHTLSDALSGLVSGCDAYWQHVLMADAEEALRVANEAMGDLRAAYKAAFPEGAK